jgi:hypothetical protein
VILWGGPGLGLILGGVLVVLIFLAYLVLFFLPVMVAAAFVSLRRLQRQRVLRRAALAGAAGLDHYLDVFRQSVDSRFEDVEFHLKYAEALFNSGRVKEAAVEARLLLLQDPYHFGGNLLLAHAYDRLNLPNHCRQVCHDYLAVNGYCFEFGELRDRCQWRGDTQ